MKGYARSGAMRLLFVIDSFGSGGAQRQMVTLARGIVARGHHVEFFVYAPQHEHFRAEVEGAGIRVHAHPKRRRFSPGVVLALRRVLWRGGFDAVLAFLAVPALYAELAALGTGVPVVASERTAYPAGPMPAGLRAMQQMHRLAAHVVVNSHHQRAAMVREFPWMASRSSTILNGVDLERCVPRSPGTAPAGADGPLRLLAVGSVVRNKNPVGLVRGLAAHRDAGGPPVLVRWAGKRGHNADSEAEYRSACALLAELGLDGSWEWLGERADVPALIAAHDALVHPSFLEGFPNAICEGLACGRPVLASGVGDHALLVGRGERGALFDPASPASIGAAIGWLAGREPQERRRMESAAREFARRELSMERFVSEYEELFRRLTGVRRGTPTDRHELQEQGAGG